MSSPLNSCADTSGGDSFPDDLAIGVERSSNTVTSRSCGAIGTNCPAITDPSFAVLKLTGALATSTVSLSTAIEGSVIAGQLVPIAPQDPEVTVFEDRSTRIAKSSGELSLPEVSAQEFNGDDISQIDDWLMYLSAQSMASIRSIIGDRESFNDYQLAEAQNSDNIYLSLIHI